MNSLISRVKLLNVACNNANIIASGRMGKGFAGTTYIPKPAFGQKPPEPPFLKDPTNGWNYRTHRVGAIGKKLGMTTVYVDHVAIPVTVIELPDNQVVQVKRKVNDGSNAVQVGAGEIKLKNIGGTLKGHFAKADVPPKRVVMEFKVTKGGFMDVGTSIDARHFVPGQLVKVQGTSTGKGFAGGMKRWNFSGLLATHGVSKTHRSIGSTGCRQTPGRVFKGKKMPGRLGGQSSTVNNLQVVKINSELNVIMVKGAVPGKNGGYLRVTDSRSNVWKQSPPFPTYIAQPGELDVELTIEKPNIKHPQVVQTALPVSLDPLLLKINRESNEVVFPQL
ncbi:ribosomal protein L3 [Cavenderia fasciculata]|uniref:Large ribosomal subunit protein uL3m n=1 Tax=Cavenderia fasciculata TaxID=261658 RepID=F4PT60_CACFS|nr:ribosomal protein L3 [Cavenderia fasciculata]EGG20796.1 ribosomal protein L3 [Cavenderia fasciculata]|eukprot:XP_004358646.1 ribosomal protein L3 [Cavenderia fasciculata]